MANVRWPIILLPGAVMPAGPAYAALLDELGESLDAHPKELELYADAAPPPDYSLATEIDGIVRTADGAGLDRFHLVGYSAGGAASLAFAAAHPDRLLSLALMSPSRSFPSDITSTRRTGSSRRGSLPPSDPCGRAHDRDRPSGRVAPVMRVR